MKKQLFFSSVSGLLFVSALLFVVVSQSGCAASYRPVVPKNLSYPMASVSYGGVSTSYLYDVLQYSGNIKYAKKEQKKGVRIVAVKITNNSGSPITLGQNAIFFNNETSFVPMPVPAIKMMLRQHPEAHLLYAPLTLLRLYISSGYTTTSYPIGLGVGPGLVIGNMGMAASANKHFFEELEQYSLIGKTVQPGETMIGLVGLSSSVAMGSGAISVRPAIVQSSN